MFNAVIAVWEFGSSCSMPTLVLESSWKRRKRAAIEAATDAEASNTRCNKRSSTDLPMDFTTSVLSFLCLCHALRVRCLEESEANQRDRRGREMETIFESTRARHECTWLAAWRRSSLWTISGQTPVVSTQARWLRAANHSRGTSDSDKGRCKRKLANGKKESEDDVMAKGKLRGEDKEKNGLRSQEEYMVKREPGSVRLLCPERTPTTWTFPEAAATTETRPRDHFQVETITTEAPSAGFSCWDLSHCVTMAMGSEANCSSTMDHHHFSQRIWSNDQAILWENNQASIRIVSWLAPWRAENRLHKELALQEVSLIFESELEALRQLITTETSFESESEKSWKAPTDEYTAWPIEFVIKQRCTTIAVLRSTGGQQR